jgi:methyltransferase (TIGR00027 family)
MTEHGSQTAEVMALFRALETLGPSAEPLFVDPYAERFLRPSGYALALLSRVPPLRALIVRIVDRKWPGARTSAVARTRLVDDLVKQAVRGGVAQVVLLGAGFDTRAYRIPEIAAARIFEVDHPATQAVKIRRVASLIAAAPYRVAHVAVDFQRQSLDTALRAAGFGRDVRSFVVWEGVTNYLSAPAVDATLRAVAGSVASGSELFFTYIHRGLLDGSTTFEGGAQILESVRNVGEPWTFGLDPAELPAYLANRGFMLLEDQSADEYRARYFGDAARAMRGYTFYRAAVARVLAPPARSHA